MNRDPRKDYILAEQVKKSYMQTTTGVFATLINSLVLAFFLLPVAPGRAVVIWVASLGVLSCLRLVLKHRYMRRPVAPPDVIKWKRLFVLAMTVSGCLWGAAGVFLFPPESIVHQVLIAFVIGGMVAGAMGVYAIIMGSFIGFSLPAMVPLVLRFFRAGGEMHTAMGGMLLLFLLLMWLAARRFYHTNETMISFQYENSALIDELRSEIGERKKAEERLLENQRRIESIVDRRTAELRDANARLSLEIEARKKAADALGESEEKYRLLVENINDVIYAINKAGIVTFVSPAIEPILGFHPREVVGKPFTELIHVEDLTRVKQRFNKVLAGFIAPQEYRIRTKHHGYIWIQASSRPIYKNDIPVGLQGVLTDLTEKKRLEAQLRQAHKMEAVGTLAGGVAHDLNNILSGLVSYPQLLLMDLPKDSPLRENVLVIQQSGERAAAIVQDLLTLARRGVPTMEAVALNDIIQDYLTSPEHENLMHHHPQITIAARLEPALLNLWGSRIHLAKTLMNLVTNAVEAIREDGEIAISTENRYVDMSRSGLPQMREGDYVVLTVADTGDGIPPEDLGKIFEPFYTKKNMGRSGTGLGMAVIWGTVQDHKGYIDVASKPGAGTSITIYLPATRELTTSREPALDITSWMGNGEVVLVVDDVAEQRELAAGILERLGYTVHKAGSGEEALVFLRDHPVELMVLDMIMETGMDGLETYRQALKINPGQRAIIVSGYAETDRVMAARRIGAGAYLKKPYLLESLGRAVHAELRRAAPEPPADEGEGW